MRHLTDCAAVMFLQFVMGMSIACSDAATLTSPTATASSPISVTYSTSVVPLGAAARLFKASQMGSVSVTLVSSGTSSGVALGLGIGIPRIDGVCLLAHSVIASAAPAAHIASTIDAGDYCVKVFDVGTLTEPVTVTIALTHP